MKILYITTVSSTINAFLVPHIEMLIDEGHQVDIATNIKTPLSEKLENLGCKIYNVPFQRNPLNLKNIGSLSKLKKILNENYDIIHTHTPVASFLARIIARKYRKNGLKVIYTVHGFHFYRGAPLINWIMYYPLEKICSYSTDILVTINKEDYKFSEKHLNSKNNVYIPGVGVNLHNFTRINKKNSNKIKIELNLNENDFVLTYVAELNENKNQNLLINSIKLLVEENKNIKLLLIGGGAKMNQYRNAINKLGLKESIHLLGKRNDISKILEITDIYVASSQREGLPVNIIEAMSMRLPIVALSNRGHSELISDNYNGYLVKENNELAFSKKIKNLMDDKEKMQIFACNSEIMASKYSIDQILIQLKKIYEIPINSCLKE